MGCEDRRLTLSLLVDGEDADSTTAFAHLAECAGCRSFFAALLALRAAVKKDRDVAVREGEALLPPQLARPAAHEARGGSSPSHRWLRIPARGWVAPFGFAVLVLAVGIAIGMYLPRESETPAVAPPATRVVSPATEGLAVVYMCSLPEYEVVATQLPLRK